MEKRVIDFITALRARGVRISIAESIDAMRAAEAAGVGDKDFFRAALRATLVKEYPDQPVFDELFPNFFGLETPQMPQMPGSGLTDEEYEQFMEQLMEQLQNMTPEQLRQLFEAMMTGQGMSREEMQQLIDSAASLGEISLRFAPPSYAARRAMRELQFDKLNELLDALMEKLREAGMSEEAIQQLMQEARQNQAALAQQMADQIGQGMAQREARENQARREAEDIMDRPFEQFGAQDADDMRAVIQRLASQLRSRVALRQKKAAKGSLDAKTTLRANMRFGAVPFDVRYRHKHLKPKLTVIVDRSVSTEQVVSFLLMLIYALQDQVSRTRSFAFIETIYDVTPFFNDNRPEQAIGQVMQEVRSKRSYSTDLGASMAALMDTYAGAIDRRTTVIVLGDARNNENDPRLDMLEAIKRRARRVVWFNPEPPYMWGRYDPGSLSSDMLKYQPLCDAVHHVSNLRQLVAAVDSLF